MSILHELGECLHSDSPAYIEFLYRYDPKKKQVFAFYEGDEDSSYYHHILVKNIEQDFELEEIVAGCKENVIKLHREFDWNCYDRKQIVFFVDRDLSFWLEGVERNDDNVFITDQYSVENYVSNIQGFHAWLVHFEGFARAKKSEINFMISEYEKLKADFEIKMMPLMAKAVIAKKHDKTISLNDFKLSTNKTLLFNIKGGHIYFEILEDKKLLNKWKLTSENEDEIAAQIHQFTCKSSHYSVRGNSNNDMRSVVYKFFQ